MMKKSTRLYLLIAFLFLFILLALAVGLPGHGFSLVFETIQSFFGINTLSAENSIVFYDIRFPRVWLAIIAGAGLSLAGTGTQAVLCNPLVSPSILGLTAGASFGASLAILFGNVLFISGGHFLLMASAFLGAMLAVSVSYGFASIGRSTRETVILAGVAISYIFSGATIFVQYLAPFQDLRAIVFWSVGSLWNADTLSISILTPLVLFCALILSSFALKLNTLLMGEETSLSVGVNVKKLRLIVLTLCAFLSAAIISFTGAIGFIGLIAPHIARSLFGSDHRWLIPSSMLMGATILLVADTGARMLMWPQELPVGIMTAMIGGPFFLVQLIRRNKDWWA